MAVLDQFLREGCYRALAELSPSARYLGNTSERSVEWYQWAFRWLVNKSLDDGHLKGCILRLREADLGPRHVKGLVTAINSYLKCRKVDDTTGIARGQKPTPKEHSGA